MPKLAGPFTLDFGPTVINNCRYDALALGGAPKPTTVVVENAPLLLIAGNPYTCASVPQFNLNTPPLPPCPIGTRTIKAEVNTTVIINGMFPVVEGDSTKLLGETDRALTGPYQYPRIRIGENL